MRKEKTSPIKNATNELGQTVEVNSSFGIYNERVCKTKMDKRFAEIILATRNLIDTMWANLMKHFMSSY